MIGASRAGLLLSKNIVYGDPYFEDVVLLIPFEGENNSTTFTDHSLYSKTLSPVGDVCIKTAQSKWGAGSAYFDGTWDRIMVTPGGSELNLGTSNFTLEGWVYPSGSGSPLIDNQSSTNYFNIYFPGSTEFGLLIGGSWVFSSIAVSANQWNHIAIIRSGTDWFVYVGGKYKNTGSTLSNPSINLTTATTIGGYNGGHYFTGYVQDIRITKNVIRYTETFTPPTEKFYHP